MICAVIFDVEGVLVDAEPYWAQARSEFANECGAVWTRIDDFAVADINSNEWAHYMIRHLDLEMSVEQVKEGIVLRMIDLYSAQIPFRPGAINAVKEAKKSWLIGIASGAHPTIVELIANSAVLTGHFDTIVTADQVDRGKPAPDVYLEAIKRLRIDPQSAVCIEDSASGILAGKAAGMHVIAIPHLRHGLAEEHHMLADCILGSLLDFSREVVLQLRS